MISGLTVIATVMGNRTDPGLIRHQDAQLLPGLTLERLPGRTLERYGKIRIVGSEYVLYNRKRYAKHREKGN
jgi:hypothetical protein